MKTKFYNRHRFFARTICFLLVFALIIFSFPTFTGADAVQWNSTYPIKWGHYSGDSLRITWYNYNVTGLISYYIESGMLYWSTLPNVIISASTSFNNAHIIHVRPTEEWWDAAAGITGGSFTPAGAQLFDTNGTEITQANVASTTREVGGANIYYSPYNNIFTNFTATNYNCMVAHELGHPLGFGDVEDNTVSIMNDSSVTINYTSLQSYDINEFNAKYTTS